MKKWLIGAVTALAFFGVSAAQAAADVPNLVGTWKVTAEGGMLTKSGKAGPKSHHSAKFGTIEAAAVITEQQGKIMHGTFTSSKASEKFVAAIGPDNKTIFFVDEDGYLEGRLLTNNSIEVVYRHSSPTESVVGTGLWTREKK